MRVRRGRFPAGAAVLAALLGGAAARSTASEDAILEPFGPAPTATSRRGVVVAAAPEAARIGAAVLANGGNAVDAAVATAFALAVSYPQAGNLAGGGFLVARTADGALHALDFRETAPAALSLVSFEGREASASVETGLGVGVPGSVRGLEEAHRRLGRLPWRDLVLPAAELADAGVVVTPRLAEELSEQSAAMGRFPATRRLFWKNGAPFRAGDRLVQRDLAGTLRAIAAGGADAFHRGPTASRVAAHARSLGGVLTAADLAAYRPVWRTPFVFPWRGRTIVTMPPPSSGGFLLASALGQLERLPADLVRRRDATSLHLVVEVLRRAFADRNRWLGDPDCVDVPLRDLLAPERLDALASTISSSRAGDSRSFAGDLVPERGGETTHLSVATAGGEAVSLTTTLNETFGVGAVVPGVGVLLNDEVDDFTTRPGRANLFGLVQGDRNAVRAGARPLSSMTPTIVLEGERPVLVLGSPGGSRIPSAVLQVLLDTLERRTPLGEAIAAGRVHHQHLPDEVCVERGGFGAEVVRRLESLGHRVAERRHVGIVHAIGRAGDGLVGAADPRGYGAAVSTETASRARSAP